MRKPLILLVALFAGSQSPVPQSGAYHVIRRYALGGDGGWDYLTLDTASRRLYIARGTRVIVIDADSGSLVGEIPNTPGVHGVALVPELHRGFASAGRDQSVRIFDTGSLHPLARLRTTGGNPDAIVYEPATRRVFTFNGAGANATAIDAVLPGVVGTVALGGKPEFAVAFPPAPLKVNTRRVAGSNRMASGFRPVVFTRARGWSEPVSNTFTDWSRPALAKPRCRSGTSATPCTPGVFGISPTTSPESASITVTRVLRAM